MATEQQDVNTGRTTIREVGLISTEDSDELEVQRVWANGPWMPDGSWSQKAVAEGLVFVLWTRSDDDDAFLSIALSPSEAVELARNLQAAAAAVR